MYLPSVCVPTSLSNLATATLLQVLTSSDWPSDPSPVWGNPCAPPSDSWTSRPKKTRSSPQRVTTPAPLLDRTFLTLAGLTLLSVEVYLSGSRFGAPYWHSGRPQASCYLTGPKSVPDNWKSPQPQFILSHLPLWGWRKPPRIGPWSQRTSSATTSVCSCLIYASSGAW